MAGKSKKVYRIYHFQERFDFESNGTKFKKGPLSYTRDYVGSGGDEESISYAQQMDMIWKDKDCHLLYSCFFLLKNIAANHSIYYRGYLLDPKQNPASMSLMADWIHLDKKTTEKIIRKLMKIALLERVDCPDFEVLKEKAALEAENGDSEDSQNFPDNSGNSRKNPEAFHETGKGKGKGKKKRKVEKEKEKESTPGNGDNPKKKKSDSSNPKKEKKTETGPQTACKASKQKGKENINPKAEDPIQPETQAQNEAECQSGHKAQDPGPIHPPQPDAGGAQSGSLQPTEPACSDLDDNRLT